VEILIETVGWIGTALVILAYFLVSKEYVTGKNAVYQLMNFFGAIGLGINVFYYGAWPSLAINIVWSIIAAVSLVSIFSKS